MQKLVFVTAATVKSFAARSITTLSAMTHWVCSGMNNRAQLRPVRVYARIRPLGLRVPRNKGSPVHPRW